jgi:hypothetical protein
MMTWLSKIDPNVAISVVAAILAFLYQHLFSPSAQAKIAQRIADALYVADSVMGALVAASPPGTTKQDLEVRLWNAAKLQLAHIGVNLDKIPPAIESAARAQIAKWLTQLPDASSGKAPALAPVPALPPIPPPPPVAVIPPKDPAP